MLIKINIFLLFMLCWYFLVFFYLEWVLVWGIDENIGGKIKEELNNNLWFFYVEVRNKDGGNYSRSILFGFWSGIERFLNNLFFKKGIYIVIDFVF